MTHIDFYILPEDTMAARDHFACRLAEKAHNMGRHVVIHVDDEDHGTSLAHYLWSFKPESFVPNKMLLPTQTGSQTDSPSQENERVIIDWQGQREDYHDVLINLTDGIPDAFSRYQKLSEIVIQDADRLPITRSHFTFYRDRGYPLQSHDLRSAHR